MEINVKITAPELAEALNNFANTLSAFMVSGAQYPEATAADIARASAKAVKAPEVVKVDKQVQQPVMEMPPTAEAEAPKIITPEQLPDIRAKVKAFLDKDTANRATLKEWLSAHDTDRVTHVRQSDVPDLLALIGG